MDFEDLLILIGFGGILAFIHERIKPPCRYALPAIGAGVAAYVLFRDKGEKPMPPPSVAESSTEEIIAETKDMTLPEKVRHIKAKLAIQRAQPTGRAVPAPDEPIVVRSPTDVAREAAKEIRSVFMQIDK